MHNGHLQPLVIAALRVLGSGSVRQVCETIAEVTEAPKFDCVLATLQRFQDDGVVVRRAGRPAVWRLTRERGVG